MDVYNRTHQQGEKIMALDNFQVDSSEIAYAKYLIREHSGTDGRTYR